VAALLDYILTECRHLDSGTAKTANNNRNPLRDYWHLDANCFPGSTPKNGQSAHEIRFASAGDDVAPGGQIQIKPGGKNRAQIRETVQASGWYLVK
jgi:hypothetical protein